MKKVLFTLLFIPIFLITALNFHEKNDNNHPEVANRVTCSACHVTIVDGIIIGGKFIDDDYVSVEVFVNGIDMVSSAVVIEKANRNIYSLSETTQDILNTYVSFDLSQKINGKKAQSITFDHYITKEERAKGFIEVEGVISDLDGTTAGDFAFKKKISLEDDKLEFIEPIHLYPSLANTSIQLENIPLNSSIEIFNVLGQLVFTKPISSETEKIDVSDFENGNYFVLVNKKDQLRFVVNR